MEGGNGLIKIGIESTESEICDQLLAHPERYFFILVTEEHIVLCIQTCDLQGENIREHAIDCLAYSSHNSLVSIFQEDLWAAMMKRELFLRYLDGDRYPISPAIRKKIAGMPGLIKWITTAILSKERCLLIYMP